MTCNPEHTPRLLAAAAARAVRAWATPDPTPAHRAAAVALLAGEEAGADGQAESMLAHALCGATSRLSGLVAVALEMPPTADGQCARRDGMLAADAALADWTALHAADRAAALRRKSRDRLAEYDAGACDASELFKLWADSARGALRAVARTLWVAGVQDEWRERSAERPAIARGVALDVLAPVMCGRVLIADSGLVRDTAGQQLGRIAALDAQALQVLQANLDLFRSVAAHRLLRCLVLATHDAWMAGRSDPWTVEFVGGFGGLAQTIGDRTNDFRRLQAILNAGQQVNWEHPAMTIGGLWTWTYHRGGPGSTGLLRIRVGDALGPTLGAQLARTGGHGRLARLARRLVPELRHEPPLSAVRDSDQGAAWMLHRLLLVELVDHASVLASEGSVPIRAARWRELAVDARLPASSLSRLLGSWASGDSIAPPLCLEAEPGRFTLAAPHAAAREFIAESGRRRVDGAAAARKGLRSKRRSDRP